MIDKQKLLAHFRKDPVLFAYHIGDLDDFFFPLCQWHALENDNGDIDEIVLSYNNTAFPTVMCFGLTDRFNDFLHNIKTEFPDRFYCHFRNKSKSTLEKYFDIHSLGIHLKMKLTDFKPAPGDDNPAIKKLTADSVQDLIDFYKSAYPDVYFDPRIFEKDKCFAYFNNGRIASVATIHVFEPKYRIAIPGSIATHPDYRGRGLATMVTSRLVRDLVDEADTIALNVKADNYPAINCYKRLGFEIAHEYEEAELFRK